MDDSESTLLPTPLRLLQELPASSSQAGFIAKSRDIIKQILKGEDRRLLLVVGPCSIHDPVAALEYASRLKSLSLLVSDTFYLVMRFYVEKSRTSIGWKGLLHDPYLDGSHAIVDGLTFTRQLLLNLSDQEIPAAAELLDPFTAPYYSDLLSWGCIGARTAESLPHRLMVSGHDFPIGFKNNTSGSIESAINGVLVAGLPHTLLGMQPNGQIGVINTKGNPEAHIVLRGGQDGPNYDSQSNAKALELLKKANLLPKIIVDCSHDNSNRNHTQQETVFNEVLAQVKLGNTSIRGLILESHLFAGSQPHQLPPSQYAVSITDPCLGWAQTASLIQLGRQTLLQEQNAFL